MSDTFQVYWVCLSPDQINSNIQSQSIRDRSVILISGTETIIYLEVSKNIVSMMCKKNCSYNNLLVRTLILMNFSKASSHMNVSTFFPCLKLFHFSTHEQVELSVFLFFCLIQPRFIPAEKTFDQTDKLESLLPSKKI